ncbi:lipoprotein NlpI [Lignipirellula cremea]|uniref:Lipoprotein NlpI n=2 Tax=Lignipirellula cremea TaxID=2528010 RepID=A0A518E4A0_9BACT|nr:lipoprotein NlpI [Lignipirellula cremea]
MPDPRFLSIACNILRHACGGVATVLVVLGLCLAAPRSVQAQAIGSTVVAIRDGKLLVDEGDAPSVETGDLLTVTAKGEDWFDIVAADRPARGRIPADQVTPLAEAVPLFDKLVADQPRQGKYLRRRALAKNAGGQQAAAQRDFELAVELDPQDFKALIGLGMMLRLQGQAAQAVERLNHAIELNADNSAAYQQRALAWEAAQNWANAIKDWSDYIRLLPQEPAGYRNRGNLQRIVRNYREATVDLDRAIELDAKSAVSYRFRGLSHRDQQQYEQANADFSLAISLAPSDTAIRFDRAYTRALQRDHAGAAEDYTEVIRLSPQNHLAYNNRGICHENQADYLAAAADYSKGIELAPGYMLLYINRGRVHTHLKQGDKAIADYEQARKLNPQDTRSHHALIGLWESREKWSELVEIYDALIRLEPASTTHPLKRAACLARGGKHQAALAACEQLLQKAPQAGLADPAALDLKARILLASRDETAEEDPSLLLIATRACANGQWRNWEHIVTLAAANAAAGDFEAAMTWLNLAKEQAPEDKQLPLQEKWKLLNAGTEISAW